VGKYHDYGEYDKEQNVADAVRSFPDNQKKNDGEDEQPEGVGYQHCPESNERSDNADEERRHQAAGSAQQPPPDKENKQYADGGVDAD